jgi:hypothetical protein
LATPSQSVKIINDTIGVFKIANVDYPADGLSLFNYKRGYCDVVSLAGSEFADTSGRVTFFLSSFGSLSKKTAVAVDGQSIEIVKDSFDRVKYVLLLR